VKTLPRVQLPPGCAGFADGDDKFRAEHGPGSFVNIDDTDPAGQRALKKLAAQDYASAGLVDAGPEKHFIRGGPEGRWCPHCTDSTIWHSWTKACPSCGGETIPESQMARQLPDGPYVP
jgi:predicted RNA-binding Zn-ribbon protein involved in translation (DUF1610 family)